MFRYNELERNYIKNEMTVFGNRKSLDIFKSDMAGDCKNSILSFQNVIPEPKDTSEWLLEWEYWPGSENWKGLSWGCKTDALFTHVKDEGECLFYTFKTQYGAPLRIYEALGERYSDLDFEILIIRIIEINTGEMIKLEITYNKGELLKKDFFYTEEVPWRNNQWKDLYYRKDLLKNTLQVIKEEIYEGGEIICLEDADNDSLLSELLNM